MLLPPLYLVEPLERPPDCTLWLRPSGLLAEIASNKKTGKNL